VPRYYLDLREGELLLTDEEGLEFDSLDAAEYETARTAAQIWSDRLLKGNPRDITIEVRNEHDQQVLTATISMRVRRVDPSLDLPRT
jgi:hypothetical protein